jgi:hypothetical protein
MPHSIEQKTNAKKIKHCSEKKNERKKQVRRCNKMTCLALHSAMGPP